MLRPNNFFKRLLPVVCFFISTAVVAGQTENAPLIRLRQQLAVDYLQPAPHLALAKYYWQKNDRLQAFYISEYARRARFPEAVFNRAFADAFGGAARTGDALTGGMTWLDQSKQDAAVAPPATDKPATEIFNKAAELQKQGRLKQAEELFVKAAALAPDSVYIQSWTGRFFYKVKADDERALEYYLTAYFLDPHAYETEFVESRVRKINWEAAQARYTRLIKSGAAPTLILNDVNPTVVLMALEQMAARWQPAYLNFVLEKMSHDDETVRWQATAAVLKNVDRSFDKTLETLLRDEDLRRRGLAAFIAVHLRKEESFPHLQNMLGEKAELLRFDALSVLIENGSLAAVKIILEHRRNETDATLKQMIEKFLQSSRMEK